MEKTMVLQQHRTNRGQLVVPLDMPRTIKTFSTAILSGTAVNIPFSGGGGGSGCYVGYLAEMLVTELSNNAGGRIQLLDKAGSGISPHFFVAGQSTVCWKPCPCPAGPICSGIEIENESLFGEVTLIVQINPNAIE